MWKGKHRDIELAVKVVRVPSGNLDKFRSVGHRPQDSNGVNEGAHYDRAEILQGSHDVEKS